MRWLASWLLCAALPLVAADPLPFPRVVPINDRVFVLLGPVQHANPQNQGYMVNSTLIIGDRGAIVVDPGGTDEVGWHIATTVLGITSKRVTHVINTHPHGDHIPTTAGDAAETCFTHRRQRAGNHALTPVSSSSVSVRSLFVSAARHAR